MALASAIINSVLRIHCLNNQHWSLKTSFFVIFLLINALTVRYVTLT